MTPCLVCSGTGFLTDDHPDRAPIRVQCDHCGGLGLRDDTIITQADEHLQHILRTITEIAAR